MQKIRKLQAVIFNDTENFILVPFQALLTQKPQKKKIFPKKRLY